jgi:hypothetical protein
MRGMVVLSPESLGVPPEVHARIYEQEKRAFSAKERITAELIPDILEVLNAPGLVAACNKLVGHRWAIVPFTHNTPFVSGSHDQHWHKDDNGPYNGRKQRHHQAVQVEMLYYPQDVREDMGPTATIPYSHYWTFNHEENQDNFAGADHLDFAYQLNGMERVPVSGPRSDYDPRDIVERSTDHDARMRDAVTNTGWPLVHPFEAGPLRAGSVVVYSHNLFHRGNHRRDDWQSWKENPRFMWRFWLYRTTDPEMEEDAEADVCWDALGTDPLTGADLSNVPHDAVSIWRHQHHWLTKGKSLLPSVASIDEDIRDLEIRLRTSGDAGEPQRIGAAYELASLDRRGAAVESLGKALHDERESVRRAATYGLVACGADATSVFLQAVGSPVKWVRKAGVFGLGEVALPTDEVLAVVCDCLANDPSVYVRSVAADGLGCMARRAIAQDDGVEHLDEIVRVLGACLDRETNRLAMNIAQERSIKFVRPTDECDVCEGIGIDYGVEAFEPVRSLVRENALWAFVILCTHGERLTDVDNLVKVLTGVIERDENVFSVGLATDALYRLGATNGAVGGSDAIEEIVSSVPLRDWESLSRAGASRAVLERLAAK